MTTPVNQFRQRVRQGGGSMLSTAINEEATIDLAQIMQRNGLGKRAAIELALRYTAKYHKMNLPARAVKPGVKLL